MKEKMFRVCHQFLIGSFFLKTKKQNSNSVLEASDKNVIDVCSSE